MADEKTEKKEKKPRDDSKRKGRDGGGGQQREKVAVVSTAEAVAPRGLRVHPLDALYLRMVGRDAGPDEPERRRQEVDQVDLEALVEQLRGRVEAGRPGADDGDPAPGAHCVVGSVIPHHDRR